MWVDPNVPRWPPAAAHTYAGSGYSLRTAALAASCFPYPCPANRAGCITGITFAVAQIRAVLSLIRESALSEVAPSKWHGLASATLLAGLQSLAT